jgi:hypothetical protein
MERSRDGPYFRSSVSVFLDVPAGDVALRLEDLGDVRLDLRVGHRHGVVVRGVRVAQARKHVRDRVSHCHVLA